jgi:hypothetical protein
MANVIVLFPKNGEKPTKNHNILVFFFEIINVTSLNECIMDVR